MKTIICPVQSAAKKYPHRAALIRGGEKISYQQLDQMVWATARQLKKHKLKRHDRVAIISQPGVDYVILLLALWRNGMVAVPLNPAFPFKTIQKILRQTKCRALISSIDEILATPAIAIKKFSLPEMIATKAPLFWSRKKSRLTLDQDATILLTSGSTGEPKAVLHTYGNHYANAHGANENMPMAPEDRWLLSLPFYHVSGIGILFRVLSARAAMVIPQRKRDLVSVIAHEDISHVSLVTTQLLDLLKTGDAVKILSGLKAILIGGSPIPRSLIAKAVTARLPLYITYGLTEMASQVATSSAEDVMGSFYEGVRVLPQAKVQISSLGEVMVKGKSLFKGYVKGDEVIKPFTPDGWFATKDQGSLTADGYLKITRRQDHMFVSGGENIYPEEIEKYLYDFKQITQALVAPVEDERYGCRPVAFIKCEEDKKIDADEMKTHLQRYLPRFKIPVAFYDWPAAAERDEMTVTHKRLKRVMQKQVKQFKEFS